MLWSVSFIPLQCCTSCIHNHTMKILRWMNLNEVFWMEDYSLNFTPQLRFPKADNNSLIFISSLWSTALISGILWASEALWIPIIHFCSMSCLQGSSLVSVIIILYLTWTFECCTGLLWNGPENVIVLLPGHTVLRPEGQWKA